MPRRLFCSAAAIALSFACGNNPPVIILDIGGPPPGDAGLLPEAGPADTGIAGDAEPPEAGEPDSGIRSPTFTEVYRIVTNTCSCHTTLGTAPNMPDQNTAHAALVGPLSAGDCGGTALVVAGNATNSVFYKKLSGTACGTREPRDRGPLPTEDLDLIAAWINNGALDD